MLANNLSYYTKACKLKKKKCTYPFFGLQTFQLYCDTFLE